MEYAIFKNSLFIFDYRIRTANPEENIRKSKF